MVYFAGQLDATFGALADPTRRAILRRLTAGPRTIGELAAGFDMSLPAVSKHVRVLQRAALLTVARDGRARRTRLRAAPLRRAAHWLARYQVFWDGELDRLAVYLEGPSAQEPAWPSAPRMPRSSKSAASSARRRSASLPRGPRRRS